jgi:uncharacterized Fe-S cluster-containing protein
METSTKTMELLPKLDCGVCGYKTCIDFATMVDKGEEELKRCIHIAEKLNKEPLEKGFNYSVGGTATGEKMGWKDYMHREFDFILDMFPGEQGPRETILPYNPALVKELGVKKGDVMIGRPMGMSCGCPVTHCGIVGSADARNGVIDWFVTGPLGPRSGGFVDIGYYIAQGYEGIISESKVAIELGRRYWFMPRRCMLQWRHSGLINAVTKLKDGSYKVRIEVLMIG